MSGTLLKADWVKEKGQDRGNKRERETKSEPGERSATWNILQQDQFGTRSGGRSHGPEPGGSWLQPPGPIGPGSLPSDNNRMQPDMLAEVVPGAGVM